MCCLVKTQTQLEGKSPMFLWTSATLSMNCKWQVWDQGGTGGDLGDPKVFPGSGMRF